MSGNAVEDPVGRLRYAFEHRGDVLHVDLVARPGAMVAEHLHPAAEERFRVLEGDVAFRVAGREVRARGGEDVTVAAGVLHAFRNPGPADAHLAVELEPGAGFEPLFRDSAALARSGALAAPGRPRGWRGLLASVDYLDRYRDLFRPASPPPFLQRLLVPPLARLARRAGHAAPRAAP
jgi:hypothetical protein